MQSINQLIHKTLSPATYFCHVNFQGNLADKFSVITNFRANSKSIAENRSLNRLKYKTPGAHLHIARIFHSQEWLHRQTDRRTDSQTDSRRTDRRTPVQKQYVTPLRGPPTGET